MYVEHFTLQVVGLLRDKNKPNTFLNKFNIITGISVN